MKAVNYSKILSTPIRAVQSAAPKLNGSDSHKALTVVETGDGVTCATLPCPNGWQGLTRLVAIFNAGSRYEKSPNMHGISHLIRRSCGLSTNNYTAVNLTRHVQQMGGHVMCHTTREHLIYSIDVAPNLASRAGHILSTMATRTAFYEWELKDLAYKLIRKDVDLLNRRQFDILTVELLHEAAFGRHPDGTGLGNSLYSDANRIGSHSIVDIDAYLRDRLTPSNVAFLATGTGPSVDGLEVCEVMREAACLRDAKAEKLQPPKHGFLGGELRRELTGSDVTYAAIAWPTAGRVSSAEECLILSVCASALVAPVQSIAYGATESALLNAAAAEGGAVVAPLHFSYSDNGLFGFMVSGRHSRAVSEVLVASRGTLGDLATKGLSSEQFERAKSRFKAEVMMRGENQRSLTDEISVQLLDKSSVYRSPEEVCAAVDGLKLDDVNKVLKSVVSAKTMALATVGSNVAFIPHVATLASV